eukprot:TRINITY_DN46322_c0_g1_i2.p2 TRINITY_DN46322_c0_g1~~TRINITY_DN46322_c0_g1_i2.p2  ORF type:complete len:225 (-),score=39.71 TRINITY_DN46322_c0_g1_i2:114-788(-)
MERRELHRGMEDALRRAEELATQKEHQVEEAMAREANARQHAKEAERTARELEMISDQERMAREQTERHLYDLEGAVQAERSVRMEMEDSLRHRDQWDSPDKEWGGDNRRHAHEQSAHTKAEVYRERSARREAELAAAEMGAKTRLDELMRVEAEDYANMTRQELAATRGDWGNPAPALLPPMPAMDGLFPGGRAPSPDEAIAYAMASHGGSSPGKQMSAPFYP